MKQMIPLIALVAGIGTGYALSPATWAVIAATGQPEVTPPETVVDAPSLVDVTTLVDPGDEWDPADRVRLAEKLDTLLIENDYEVRVEASGIGNRVLVVKGSFGRVRTLKLAKEFDFKAFQTAGFAVFLTEVSGDAHGYIVDQVLADGLGAPLGSTVLVAHFRSLKR